MLFRSQLESKLRDFGIEVEVESVHPGPVITRFEILPAPGVKVSQISNLSKDLARSLSVIGVRVVEIIPGKSVMGLEIPNENRELVKMQQDHRLVFKADWPDADERLKGTRQLARHLADLAADVKAAA